MVQELPGRLRRSQFLKPLILRLSSLTPRKPPVPRDKSNPISTERLNFPPHPRTPPPSLHDNLAESNSRSYTGQSLSIY